MGKFLSITESNNFGSGAELIDEQTFQSYMPKVPIWDFLKVNRLEYIAMSNDQYVHAMKNLDTGLNGEFIRDCKLLFLFIFCFCLNLSC